MERRISEEEEEEEEGRREEKEAKEEKRMMERCENGTLWMRSRLANKEDALGLLNQS